ncbi:cell adhesion molecule DSCAM-like [Sycon ciliatum]|uniref:cell adhesion molecule DSCAM-like n=1 Tax=Sycon ciliatum TaxID=27933 RepID=UPI0031F64B74
MAQRRRITVSSHRLLVCPLILSLISLDLVLGWGPAAPRIDSRDTDLLVNLVEGDSSTGFTVHCQKSLRVDGAVPLDLRWTFNGELIPLERQKIETVNGSSHVSYTNTLDLNVRGTWLEADAGTYGCSARITGTNETSFPGKFQLVVNVRPEVLTLEDAQVGLQENVTLTCTTRATLPLNFTWSRGSTVLETAAKVNNNTNTFTLTNANRADAGNYTCRASNRFGSASDSAVVNLIAAPDARPSISRIVPIFLGSLQIEWTGIPLESAFGDLQGYTIAYTTINCKQCGICGRSLCESNGSIATDAKEPLRHALRGLHHGTKYSVTVAAHNKAGTGPRSAPQTAWTNRATPDAPKSLQARPELGARGIRVTFTPPLPKLGGGITRYELTYVSLEPGHQFVPITHSISRFSSRRATVRLRVLGLQRLTKYLFTVRAVNSYGRGQPATIEGTTEAFPVITSPPSIVELRRGATAVLRCTSKGTPDTLVYWVTPSLPSLDANLRLVDVKPSDAGTYECKAKNKWGEDTHVTRIIVRPSPFRPRPTVVHSPPFLDGFPLPSIPGARPTVRTTSRPGRMGAVSLYTGIGMSMLFVLAIVISVWICRKRFSKWMQSGNTQADQPGHNAEALGWDSPSFNDPGGELGVPSHSERAGTDMDPRRPRGSRLAPEQERTTCSLDEAHSRVPGAARRQGSDVRRSMRSHRTVSAQSSMPGECRGYEARGSVPEGPSILSQAPPPPYSIVDNNAKPSNPPSYESVLAAEQPV